jgi:hypothetical protein
MSAHLLIFILLAFLIISGVFCVKEFKKEEKGKDEQSHAGAMDFPVSWRNPLDLACTDNCLERWLTGGGLWSDWLLSLTVVLSLKH